MSWNYRWFRVPNRDGSTSVACYEVYYDTRDRPTGSTKGPVAGPYESIEEADQAMRLMRDALQKPLLEDTHAKLGYYAELTLDKK